MSRNAIPPITEPLGRHWIQPSLDAIAIDDTHALMNARAFELLHEYSTTIPSGVYAGKMWKASRRGEWWLKWFGIVQGNPEVCSINNRRILIA